MRAPPDVVDEEAGDAPPHWRGVVPDDRMAHLVKGVWRGLTRAFQTRLGEHSVSFGHWVFLRILWEKDGITQSELSQEAGLSAPTSAASVSAIIAVRCGSVGAFTASGPPGFATGTDGRADAGSRRASECTTKARGGQSQPPVIRRRRAASPPPQEQVPSRRLGEADPVRDPVADDPHDPPRVDDQGDAIPVLLGHAPAPEEVVERLRLPAEAQGVEAVAVPRGADGQAGDEVASFDIRVSESLFGAFLNDASDDFRSTASADLQSDAEPVRVYRADTKP